MSKQSIFILAATIALFGIIAFVVPFAFKGLIPRAVASGVAAGVGILGIAKVAQRVFRGQMKHFGRSL
jgi:uncharacterized membrane protein